MNKLTTVLRGDSRDKNHRGYVNSQDFDPTNPDRDTITQAGTPNWAELTMLQSWYIVISFATDSFAPDVDSSRYLLSQNKNITNGRGFSIFQYANSGEIGCFYRSFASSSRQALLKTNDKAILDAGNNKQNIFQYSHEGGINMLQNRMYLNGRLQNLIVGDTIADGTLDLCMGYSCAPSTGSGKFGDFDGRFARIQIVEGIPTEQQVRDDFNRGYSVLAGGQTMLVDVDFDQTTGTPQDLSPNAYPVVLNTTPATYTPFIT
jgi:hypothetical protein